MKKLLLVIFLFCGFKSNAQINLDTTLGPGAFFDFEVSFKIVQISETETKYYFGDTINNTFSLYNMDFTPFIMNISVPEPFHFYGNDPNWFKVLYISRTLFDCDSSNIEYAYCAPNGGYGLEPFYIMRVDGTQLLKVDSARGPYCFGCNGGSDDLRPIKNTSSGARLLLMTYSGLQIYSLCGSIPLEVMDFQQTERSFVTLFPNPSSMSVTFQINTPENLSECELVIVDANAREIKRELVKGRNNITFDTHNFGNGNYMYSLCTKTKSYQTGKFIITK